MKKRILFLTVLTGMLHLASISTVYAQDNLSQKDRPKNSSNADMTHDAGDSIVHYNIIDAAKNLMSCAAYYEVMGDDRAAGGFTAAVKWMFMADASQTEEETAAWIATAKGAYNQYWTNIKNDDSFESGKTIETQLIECHNLGLARKILGTEPPIEQVE